MRGLRFILTVAILAACLTPGQLWGANYPDEGAYPTPMWGTTFRVADPLNAGVPFNDDGTNSQQPATDAGSVTLGSVNYLLKKLTIMPAASGSDSINFRGSSYVVYSAVPENMTISYAYQNAGAANLYYSQAAIGTDPSKAIDFNIPTTINGGNATAVNNPPPSAPVLGASTQENVYLTVPPGTDSQYFIPNLPNTSGQHNGLTANIYFMGDPFLGKPGYWPDTSTWPYGTYHLAPYGWALDPRTVSQGYTVQLLNADGGSAPSATTFYQATAALRNLWKHTIQGYDYISSDPSQPANSSLYTVQRDLLQPFFNTVQTDPNYPFPPSAYQSGNYPSWFQDAGCYFHVQPQPGFQRNLLRYYTAWGAYCLYNQTSDLFVRADGTIELPGVNGDSGWRYAPIVTQTWDGSQRATVLNTTAGPVPSTYDDYPGAEYYLPGNMYLPGKAGVVTTYVNYLVQDSTGLTARETDLWMGLKGDTVNDVLYWADAPIPTGTGTYEQTEPGGQANKPYMFGGYTNPNPDPNTQATNPWQYKLRLQSSNSFCVARLPQTALQGKLYDASFYADLGDGKGYQLVATISYKWQPWTIGAGGVWTASSDAYGAGVPQLTYANPNLSSDVHIQVSTPTSWGGGATGGTRVITWGSPQNIDPSTPLSDYANKLGSPLAEYFVYGVTINSAEKFLIVLGPPPVTAPMDLLLLD